MVDPKGLPRQDFVYTFSMDLYHKLDVKNGLCTPIFLFSLISDGLGGVL
jgi:hypothetical protein